MPNLTNSVYKLNNNVSETEKSGITTTYKTGRACCQVITWLRNPCLVRDSRYIENEGSQDMFTREACEQSRHVGSEHVSIQDMLVREHLSTQGTVALEHVST